MARRIGLRSVAIGVLMCALVLGVNIPAALGHAELLQSSPRAGSVVGGEFHSIRMQFTGLDGRVDHELQLFGPDGRTIPSTPVKDEAVQRLIIPIDPLEIPGEYTVTYTVTGIDGDVSDGTFSFFFQPSAAEPEPITIALDAHGGFDWVSLLLLMAAAACLAFLAIRFRSALAEHRAASADSPIT